MAALVDEKGVAVPVSQRDPDVLLTSELYFGRHVVRFCQVKGSLESVKKQVPATKGSEEAMKQVHHRLKPLIVEEERLYPLKLYVPAVPALVMEDSISALSANIVPILQQPLIKSPQGTIYGIRSGGRSGLLRVSEKGRIIHYRLKGCGNYVNAPGLRFPAPGFPLRESDGAEGEGHEVRGCCFLDTAEREQVMSHKVARLLKKVDGNMQCGNTPLGIWKYPVLDGDLTPTIQKYCGIFETLGERRLSQHLLSGVEHILPLLIPVPCVEEWLGWLSKERRGESTVDEPVILPTWSACLTGVAPIPPVDLRERPLLHDILPAEAPSSVPKCYVAQWDLLWKELMSISCPIALGTLYWRLGFETGAFAKLLEDNEMSWGYFFDHCPFEPHCNAHPANFVVVPPSQQDEGPLLAPVDFDLAYTKTSFVSPYTGAPDDDLFASWSTTEAKELKRALAGEQVNTGVLAGAGSGHQAEQGKAHQLLRWMLRDTLLCGVEAGRSASCMIPPSQETLQERRVWRILVELALMVTSDVHS